MRLQITLPPDIEEAIIEMAEAEGRTVRGQMERLLTEAVADRQAPQSEEEPDE